MFFTPVKTYGTAGKVEWAVKGEYGHSENSVCTVVLEIDTQKGTHLLKIIFMQETS